MLDTISNNIPMPIADRIRQLRKVHGLTQDDLAAKAGLSIATIQRLERGEPPSAATIASIAAAFALSPSALTSVSKPIAVEPTSGSYLPLTPITSGKRLIDMVASASALDLDYMDIEDEVIADLLGRLYDLCQPRHDREIPANPGERIRLDVEASKLLKELKVNGLTLAGEIYTRTHHEIDDDLGGGIPMLLAKWDETCLVLRIGTGGITVDRADVEARLGKWTNTTDPRIVRPEKPERNHDDHDEIPF